MLKRLVRRRDVGKVEEYLCLRSGGVVEKGDEVEDAEVDSMKGSQEGYSSGDGSVGEVVILESKKVK